MFETEMVCSGTACVRTQTQIRRSSENKKTTLLLGVGRGETEGAPMEEKVIIKGKKNKTLHGVGSTAEYPRTKTSLHWECGDRGNGKNARETQSMEARET